MDYRALFERIELSVSALARKARVGRSTLVSWAAARADARSARGPSAESLRRVADALDAHAGVLRREARVLRAEARRLEGGGRGVT